MVFEMMLSVERSCLREVALYNKRAAASANLLEYNAAARVLEAPEPEGPPSRRKCLLPLKEQCPFFPTHVRLNSAGHAPQPTMRVGLRQGVPKPHIVHEREWQSSRERSDAMGGKDQRTKVRGFSRMQGMK